MNKKINEVLETIPEQRIIEVLFYNFVQTLIKHYNRSVVIFDLADVFSVFGECSPLIIKRLIQEVLYDTATWAPSRDEIFTVYKSLDYSVRKIITATGIHHKTQKAILEKFKNDPRQIPSFTPKMTDEDFLSVRTFMIQAKKFSEVYNAIA